MYVDNVVAQAPEQTNHATLLLEYNTGNTTNTTKSINQTNHATLPLEYNTDNTTNIAKSTNQSDQPCHSPPRVQHRQHN